MNIFVLPSVYPTEYFPGGGSFTYEQCLELSKLGHKVTVLDASSYDYHYWKDSSCQKMQKTSDGVGARYTLHTRGLMTSCLPGLNLHSYSKKIRRLYRVAVAEQGKPNMLIAHFSLPAGFAAVDLAEKENLPCVIVEHYSLFLEKTLHPYTRAKLTEAVKKTAAFICVSNSLKQAIERHTEIKNKIIVIPNMVDRRFLYSPTAETKPFVFFSAGNLNENKRFDLLIAAFCRAFSAVDNVLLTIAGNGEDRAGLEKLIKENGRSDQIELIGWVSRENIVEEYKKCHCFALLSRKETFGLVYREAMAVGRPVLATDNGGIRENWVDRNGIIIEDDSVEGVAKELKTMFEQHGRFDNKAISENCLGVLGADIVVNKIDDVLKNVTKIINN